MAEFWEWQEVVTCKNGYNGPHFQTKRGKTQGSLISPTLFNLVVYNVIRNWMYMIVERKFVFNYGLGLEVGWYMGMFYADDGLVGSQDLEWLQGALNVLIVLFRWCGMVDNVSKSKAMKCQPGAIQFGMSEELVGRRATYKERQRRRIQCLDCGVELTKRSMAADQRRMHGTEPAINWNLLPVSQK